MSLLSGSGVGFDHIIRGAIAAPEGGGSPRLYLVASRAQASYFAQQVVNPVNPNYPPAVNYTDTVQSSGLMASCSTDFGGSFSPGVDVGITEQSGKNVSNGRTQKMGLSGIYATNVPHYPTFPTHIVPMTLIVTPAGRVVVRAYLFTTDPWRGYQDAMLTSSAVKATSWSAAGPNGYDWNGSGNSPGTGWNESSAPMLCENAFMRAPISASTGLPSGPTFRAAATGNQALALTAWGFVGGSSGNPAVFLDGYTYVSPSPSMIRGMWLPASAYHATAGAGGKVKGPWKLYSAGADGKIVSGDYGTGRVVYFSSSDGGDTWQTESALGQPWASTPQTFQSVPLPGAAPAGEAFGQRDMLLPLGVGWVDNGAYASSTDILATSPWVYTDIYGHSTAYPDSYGGPYNASGEITGALWGEHVAIALPEAVAAATAPTVNGYCVPYNGPPSGRGAGGLRSGAHFSCDADDGLRISFGTPNVGGLDYNFQITNTSTDAWYVFPQGASSGTTGGQPGYCVKMGLPSDLSGLYCQALAYPGINTSDFALAFTWSGRIVMVFGVNGVIRVLRSEDGGRTFTQTCHSNDNMRTWESG